MKEASVSDIRCHYDTVMHIELDDGGGSTQLTNVPIARIVATTICAAKATANDNFVFVNSVVRHILFFIISFFLLEYTRNTTQI